MRTLFLSSLGILCSSILISSETHSSYLYVSHIEGGGIGYPKGYTSFGLFLSNSYLQDDRFQFFLDIRGHIFNNGKPAANVGIGMRGMPYFLNTVLGLNIYYDYRKDWGNYNQIGVGFESLNACFDLRLNGYFPTGKTLHGNHGKEYYYSGGFVAFCTPSKQALLGGDLEISSDRKRWQPCSSWNLLIGLGPYYYHRHCDRSIFGGKLRFGLQFWQRLSLEGRYSYDNVFKNKIQGLLTLSFPIGYAKHTCCDEDPQIALEPVYRQEIIVLDKKRCVWCTNY